MVGSQLEAELFGQKGLAVGPVASVDYVFSYRPKVSESGGLIAQKISKKSLGEVSTLLGIKIVMQQDTQTGTLSADGRLGWRHFYGARTIKTTTRFNESEESFFAESDTSGRDAVEGSVRFSCQTKSGIYAGLEAVASMARNEKSLGANFVVGKKF